MPKEFANLILAFNLLSNRVCMTSRRSDFSSYEVIRSASGISDHVGIAVGFSEELDIRSVVPIFQKIQQIKRYELNDEPSLAHINLCNALQNYETGISEFNMLFKFRDIYTALELVANIDGEKKDKDNKVSKLSGVSIDIVESWRTFYNRTKHIQKHDRDMKTYNRGNKELSKNLLSIRECTKTILSARLGY